MSHRKTGHDAGPEVTLPITPMLDMTFQLLFFFMSTFNPTAPEVAQVLAMAKEKVSAEKKEDLPAKDQSKADKTVAPNINKTTPPDEKLEIDNDLRLAMDANELAGETFTLKDGQSVVRSVNFKIDKELKPEDKQEALKTNLKDLNQDLKTKLEGRAKIAADKVKDELRKAGKSEDDKTEFETALGKELATQKVRVQPSPDVPWGEVFTAMNMVTDAWREAFDKAKICSPAEFNDLATRIDFKGVALVTPKKPDAPPPPPAD